MSREKVGLYGGTFDPIHFGHLNLAIEMMEAHRLNRLWFCPAALSPHKTETLLTPAQHRLNMLRLALEQFPCCEILDSEITRDSPSYTVDTVRQCVNDPKNKDKEFYLILGEDCLACFDRWKNSEEIVSSVSLLIGSRGKRQQALKLGMENLDEAIARGLTPMHNFEISSTDVRERLSKGRYCGHLVPAKVLDYICKNKLFFT
ncbi:nicotinate (nicotinamide) nucleotide adenylyltransferase [Simkania negevensis]|uniref:Probable nicotinate-nucleotide adenylyltransferase n=1 Tax=Simkania negevensis TaxID=83561 RepID=A0ABS3AQ95_9BACT|nr:nicotinate (nicotinamide) nucleotide adenylyltransferase [Simkania negevensis]